MQGMIGYVYKMKQMMKQMMKKKREALIVVVDRM
jgi:hypothetical protein